MPMPAYIPFHVGLDSYTKVLFGIEGHEPHIFPVLEGIYVILQLDTVSLTVNLPIQDTKGQMVEFEAGHLYEPGTGWGLVWSLEGHLRLLALM